MERLKNETEATLYDLLLSGLYGQMLSGDSYGVWTFHKETQAGRFPMQVWDSRRANQLATIAAAFISNQTYEHSAEMKPMTELLDTVIHAVSNLNVFIISDGRTAMRGTPFDKAINAEYKKQRRERNSAKRPFVTALFAGDGSITNHLVAVAGKPIKLPERPPAVVARTIAPQPPIRPPGAILSNTPAPLGIPATPATAEVHQTSSTASTQSPGATNPPPLPIASLPARPESSLRPVMRIITRSNTVPATSEVSIAEAAKSNPVPASGADQTNNTPAELSAQPPPPTATATVATSASASAVESSPLRSAFAGMLPAPVTVAARELQPEPGVTKAVLPTAVQAAALPAPRDPGAGLFLAFGGLLMAAALFLLFVVIRRVRPAPGCSLITQSMERR